MTNMHVVLYDAKGTALLSFPKEGSEFCQSIEAHPEWGKKCSDCDMTYFSACKKAKQEMRYKCHLGLSEAVVPISDGDNILGFVMFGQVLTENTAEETRALLKQRFKNSDFTNIDKAIDSIPVKSIEELDASTTVLKALASYFLSNKWVAPMKNEFITQLDQYLKENVSRTITTKDICTAFHICKTRLYSLAKEYLDCSIADYVQRFRINEACRMLKETTKPITYIAFATGFCDYGHFSRIFKQIKNCSASEYRKLHQNKN